MSEPERASSAPYIAFGAVVLVFAGLGVFSLFHESASSGPPPAQPLPQSVTAHAAPPPLPASQVEGPSPEGERRQQMEASASDPEAPPMSLFGPAVTPLKVTASNAGRVSTPLAGRVTIGAIFNGQRVPAKIAIDGVYKGEAPIEATLAKGSHTVRIDYAATRVAEFGSLAVGGRSIRYDVALRTIQNIEHPPPLPKVDPHDRRFRE